MGAEEFELEVRRGRFVRLLLSLRASGRLLRRHLKSCAWQRWTGRQAATLYVFSRYFRTQRAGPTAEQPRGSLQTSVFQRQEHQDRQAYPPSHGCRPLDGVPGPRLLQQPLERQCLSASRLGSSFRWLLLPRKGGSSSDRKAPLDALMPSLLQPAGEAIQGPSTCLWTHNLESPTDQ